MRNTVQAKILGHPHTLDWSRDGAFLDRFRLTATSPGDLSAGIFMTSTQARVSTRFATYRFLQGPMLVIDFDGGTERSQGFVGGLFVWVGA